MVATCYEDCIVCLLFALISQFKPYTTPQPVRYLLDANNLLSGQPRMRLKVKRMKQQNPQTVRPRAKERVRERAEEGEKEMARKRLLLRLRPPIPRVMMMPSRLSRPNPRQPPKGRTKTMKILLNLLCLGPLPRRGGNQRYLHPKWRRDQWWKVLGPGFLRKPIPAPRPSEPESRKGTQPQPRIPVTSLRRKQKRKRIRWMWGEWRVQVRRAHAKALPGELGLPPTLHPSPSGMPFVMCSTIRSVLLQCQRYLLMRPVFQNKIIIWGLYIFLFSLVPKYWSPKTFYLSC